MRVVDQLLRVGERGGAPCAMYGAGLFVDLVWNLRQISVQLNESRILFACQRFLSRDEEAVTADSNVNLRYFATANSTFSGHGWSIST